MDLSNILNNISGALLLPYYGYTNNYAYNPIQYIQTIINKITVSTMRSNPLVFGLLLAVLSLVISKDDKGTQFQTVNSEAISSNSNSQGSNNKIADQFKQLSDIPSLKYFHNGESKQHDNERWYTVIYFLNKQVYGQAYNSSRQNVLLYMATNYVADFYSSNQIICQNQDQCVAIINQSHIQSGNISITFIIREQAVDAAQPFIISANYLKQHLFRPMRNSRTYSYTSSLTSNKDKSRNNKQSQLGQFFVFSPYAHNLIFHLQNIEGYHLILPNICPWYSLEECLVTLEKKIKQFKAQKSDNYYMTFSKISLNRYQDVKLDYCEKCYFILYVECIIGQCTSQFGFYGQSKFKQLQLQHSDYVNPSTHEQIKGKRVKLIEGKLNLISHSDSTNSQSFYFNSTRDSYFVYYPALGMQPLYYSCSHLDKSYAVQVLAQKQVLVSIKNAKKFEQIGYIADLPQYTCQIRAEEGSHIYFSNILIHSMQANTVYPLKLTRTHPAIMHIDINQLKLQQQQQRKLSTGINSKETNKLNIIYVNIHRCINSPIKLSYFQLPDFQAIKDQPPQTGIFQSSKKTQEWVNKTEIRVINNFHSFPIDTNMLRQSENAKLMTNHIIIQLVPDSYAYAEITISHYPLFEDSYGNYQKSTQSLKIVSQFYKQQQMGIQFNITIQLPKLSQEKAGSLSIWLGQTNKPQKLQLSVLCPHTIFQQPISADQKQTNAYRVVAEQDYQVNWNIYRNSAATQDNPSATIVGRTSYNYLGIYVSSEGTIHYTAIPMKSKINLIMKYIWVFAIVIAFIVLVFYGVHKLLSSSPSLPRTNGIKIGENAKNGGKESSKQK